MTKLDGTAKGGVLAAIAQERPIPVYFIGVGEKLEDLETFNARELPRPAGLRRAGRPGSATHSRLLAAADRG